MNKLYSVHDHWTDINKKNDVDIESIDGVITGIKVNGEDYSGGGESDFSTAQVTINVVGGSRLSRVVFNGLVCVESDTMSVGKSLFGDNTVEVVMYKGNTQATIEPPKNYSITSVSADGNILVEDNRYINVTGEGSITVTISNQ